MLIFFQQIQKHQLVLPILNVMFPILSSDEDDTEDEEEDEVESQKPSQLAAQVMYFTKQLRLCILPSTTCDGSHPEF